jgi:hypothetical protein
VILTNNMMKFCKTCAFLLALAPAVTAFIEDFESFAPGDVINEIVPGNGFTIGVAAEQCSDKAMIFDSAFPTGMDSDLKTPGTGVDNTVPKGNILIVSEDGNSSEPDDCAQSGVLKFKFTPDAFVSSIGLLDHEEGARILVFNSSGDSYAINVPATSNNGYASIPINDVVTRINVKLRGSGAVTELEYCGQIPGYTFYPFFDSAELDIGNESLVDTAAVCTANSACKGFNSNGWFSCTICEPFPECASTWTTSDTCEGFYLKQADECSDSLF